MTASPNRPYLPAVDQLRGFAATLVILYHGLERFGARLAHGTEFDPGRDWIITRNPVLAVIQEGQTGVALFIVLSGFILSLGAIGHRIDYGRFIAARVLRLYPLLGLLAVATYAAHPVDAGTFLITLLPLNAPDAMHGAFTGMFWAVAVEFQCYLVFPFLILLADRVGTRFLIQVIAVAVVLRVLAVAAGEASAQAISYWTVLGRIDQFCIGMIAARVYRPGQALPRWALPAALVAATAALCAFNQAGGWPAEGGWKILWTPFEGVLWACVLVSYLAATPRWPGWLGRGLTRLGEVSYPLYMVHWWSS